MLIHSKAGAQSLHTHRSPAANPPPPTHPNTERDADAGDDRNVAHEDNARESADWFRRLRLPEGETALPLDRYKEARRRIQSMPGFSLAEHRLTAHVVTPSAGTWTALGPENIGSRTRSFLVDPNSPATMYAGGVTGGVWKTTDGGKTWNPTFGTPPTVSVGAMAMDPKNSQVIDAGTGEWYQGFAGQGICSPA